MGDELEFIHMLGKETRRRIIAILLDGRSYRDLAALLGVTPAAIAKYISGATHPSDKTIARAIESASRTEREEIAIAIAEDLSVGLSSLVEWIIDERLPGQVLAKSLEENLARLRLAGVARRARIAGART
ncbi:MAG: helix-turn-helix domain-containing protein [Aeropyrum sp.]|nr:helix-turn-helix domain-containing protein [Aeropyrum sp.]MCE4615918.1 helix-turn-helix domain-containing protein [Aeropyrum sp.]